jgi:hypothetical protein
MPQLSIVGYEPLTPDVPAGRSPLSQFDPTPEEARMLAEIRARESSGNYSARNPKPGSTAAGAYQFIGPTWQLASAETGVPVYGSAAEAPPAVQDANALHMLRKYGPNADITWAASGPYKQPGGQPASGDVLSRIASGNVTPDELAQFLQPQQTAPVTPKARPATPPAVTITHFEPYHAPPSSPPQQGFLKSFAEWTVKPMADLTAAIGTANVLDYMRAGQSIADFGHMLRGEPKRIWNELAHVGNLMASGDITNADAGRHLASVVPMFGPAAVQVSEEIGRGHYQDAAGHYLALIAPGAAERMLPAGGRAIRALPEAPEVITRAAEATRAGAQAAAPDVAWGIAKAGAGYGIGELGELLPGVGPLKYAVELPSVYKGARQVGRGLKKGVAAARASFAETATPEAPVAPETPAAAPAGPPVTGPTDEALVHLYSVETDPAKRSALQAELVNRGLMNQPAEPGAVVAPEANPYRGYSQGALQRVYALEQDAAKRALIEQAARDRNLTLLSREGRRATAAVPETGYVEPRGPSLTQDDVLMLRYLGEADPFSVDAETIGIARQLAAEKPELLYRLRATGTTEPFVTPSTPAEQVTTTQPPAAQAETAGTTPEASQLPPSLERIVTTGQQAGKFTPQEQDLADMILQNVEPTAAPQPAAAFKPGDYVQWQSQGIDQFREPRQITGFSPDGKYAFVEGTNTGIPVEQLTPAEIQPAAVSPSAPAPPTAATPAPTAPETAPLTGKARAGELAAQLEASVRVETITDYLVRNKVPASMLEDLPDKDWKLISQQAGVQPPTQENIQAIRSNIAEYEGAAAQPSEAGNLPPAEAKADFEQRRTVRNKRKPPATATEAASAATPPAATTPPAEPQTLAEMMRGAPPSELESQLAQSLERVYAGERPTAQPAAAEGPRAPTASETRVEGLAQHLAADTGVDLAKLETMAENPNSLAQLERLGRALDIKGATKAEEIPQIVERVKQLRGEGPTPAEAASRTEAAAAAPSAPATTLLQRMQEKTGLKVHSSPLDKARFALDEKGIRAEDVVDQILRDRIPRTASEGNIWTDDAISHMADIADAIRRNEPSRRPSAAVAEAVHIVDEGGLDAMASGSGPSGIRARQVKAWIEGPAPATPEAPQTLRTVMEGEGEKQVTKAKRRRRSSPPER